MCRSIHKCAGVHDSKLPLTAHLPETDRHFSYLFIFPFVFLIPLVDTVFSSLSIVWSWFSQGEDTYKSI